MSYGKVLTNPTAPSTSEMMQLTYILFYCQIMIILANITKKVVTDYNFKLLI